MQSSGSSRWTGRLAEVVRFGVSGAATELVYFALLWLLGRVLDVPMWWRATLAYVGSFAVNYFMQRSFTFRSSKKHTYSGPRYLIVHAVGLAINSGVLGVTVDFLRLPFWPCQIGAIGLVAVWSYVGQKCWAF
jgi:putative flippase GtrA